MKKTLFLLLTILFCSTNVSAQVYKSAKMSTIDVYLEAGTNIIISSPSINLELLFGSSESGGFHMYGRVGFGGVGVFYGPVGLGGLGAITMLTGKNNHHFEASAGVFVGYDTGAGMGNGTFGIPLLDLGYRFQKPEGGFLFRGKVGILGVGIGLGWAF